MEQITFKYSSVIENEGRMYNDVKSFLAKNDIPENMRFNILLAVSEAFTNALTHANMFDKNKLIEIFLAVNKESVFADILDEGDADPESLANKRHKPTPYEEGGRGVDLIDKLADEVTWSRRKNKRGIVVSMTFSKAKFIKKEISL